MKTLTIVEGPDCAGKSTLIDTMTRTLGGGNVVHHFGPFIGQEKIARPYLDGILSADHDPTIEHVILDRSWLSEPIYSHAFRDGHNRISTAERRILERVAYGRSAVMIFCLPPFEACARAFAKRREEEYLKDEVQLRAVYQAYDHLRHDPPFVTMVYDYTKNQDIEHTLRWLEAIRPNPNRGPGVGLWEPGGILLVGESLNEAVGSLPFVAFEGCSLWLTDQLEAAHIPESQLYFVNALRNGRSIDSLFIRELRPRAIVALGAIAKRWCQEAGVKYFEAPHPQYWKRFKSTKPYPLINVLKELK